MRRLTLICCVVSLLFISPAVLNADTKPKKDKPVAEKKAPADKKAEKQEKKADVKKETKKEAAKKVAKKVEPKTPVVVKMTIGGNYPEGAAGEGLFSEMQSSLAKTIDRLDAAAADDEVSAVWLKIADLSVGRAKLNELRAAVARLRKAKKLVYAEVTSADTGTYLLASACDRIVMPSAGMLLIPGVRMEITFYKGLLDKLGLKFDVLKMGKYKGAAEPMSRNKMSKPLRESYEAIAEDVYQDMIKTIAADRHLKDYQVKTHIDRGLFTPADARKAGLIDEILYPDQIKDLLEKKLKSKEVKFVTDYKRKKIDTDFSGMTGMMRLFEAMLGGKKSKKSDKKPKIAVVYAVGEIHEGASQTDLFGNSSLGSTTLIAALRKAADDKNVKAIVLRIDSPGGSATASDLMWREITRTKKPIIASMGDVAASGGYYIAMGTKKIIAAPCTLTGSIGVIGGKLVTKGLYEKLGLHTEVISRGANSGGLSSNQAFTPEERKVAIATLEETYRQFVSKAAEGRNMTYSKLHELAQGRVYTGQTAKKLGLVDELGTLHDAVAAAKKAAGLKPGDEVELIELPEQRTFFQQLFEGPSAAAQVKELLPEAFELLGRAKLIRKILSERFLMWMPYEVEIK